MPYVSARKRNSKSLDVLCKDESGKVFVRHGGSRAWRNNNPGNIRKSSFATEQGAIGEAGGFAVFPDYQTGRQALKALLKMGNLKGVQLDAVLVAGRSGIYLRARPDEGRLNNLDVMAAEAA